MRVLYAYASGSVSNKKLHNKYSITWESCTNYYTNVHINQNKITVSVKGDSISYLYSKRKIQYPNRTDKLLFNSNSSENYQSFEAMY